MKLHRLSIVVVVVGASLLAGSGASRASTPPAQTLTAGLGIGLSDAMSPRAVQQDARALQARLNAALRSSNITAKYVWEQVAVAVECVAGGHTCISQGGVLVGDVTIAEFEQLGLTDTNGGAPLEAEAVCERIHVTSPNNGTVSIAENVTGPALTTDGVSGANSSGSVQLVNAAPTSVLAVALDSNDLSTGVSLLSGTPKKTADASTLVTGVDVANNAHESLRGGQLTLTLNGFVETAPFVNGHTGTPTVDPGTLSCGVHTGSLEAAAINVLAPTH